MEFMRKTVKVTLVTVNVFFALALIVACYGSRINNGDYWFTGLFALSAVYLLFINIGFVVFWLFAKFSMSVISFTALLICFFPLQHVFKPRWEDPFVYVKQKNGLRIMSWNVELFNMLEHKKHPGRKQEMMALINQFQPDVICLQEMCAADSLNKKSVNYLPDICKELDMPYHYFSYDSFHDYDNYGHHFGKLILSRFPIIGSKTIVPEKRVYNSTYQYADILVNGKTVRIFNLHLQSLKFSPENKTYLHDLTWERESDLSNSRNILHKLKQAFIHRHWQSDQIKRTITESPYPVVVCGDFNDVPNSYAYLHIGDGLTNCFREKGNGIGNTYPDIIPTLRIDHIFVSPSFEVTQFARIKKDLSDHYPIVTDVEMD